MPRPQTRADQLIGDLYEAAVTEGAPHGIPEAIRTLCQGGSATLFEFDPADGAVIGPFQTTFPSEFVQTYAQYFHRHDPWTAPLARAGGHDVVLGGEMIEDEALARTEFYNDFARHFDVFHVMGRVIRAPDGTNSVIGVQRPLWMGPFGNEARETLRDIAQHYDRSLHLGPDCA